MAIQFKDPELQELKPRIIVFGVGGAGGNAVDNMIKKSLEGVEFVAANTDAQALLRSKSNLRLQLGSDITRGLGAGANPETGAKSAEDSLDHIAETVNGADMCFITAGMGGGTGTGAAPVIARIARERGVLTVGVVTKPFAFEGARRMRIADAGISALRDVVDTLIVIPNQNLFRVATPETTFQEAFVLADDVLYQGVKGVTDLMVRPGLVNLDFADVRAVMDEMGTAMMGCGEAEGDTRAAAAAEAAIDNPLLDEISLRGARGVLINITGGSDLKLFEVDAAAERVRQEADPEAAVFFGAAFDPELEGRVRVSVVATGIDAAAMRAREDTFAAKPVAPAVDQAAAAARTVAHAIAEPGVAARAAEPTAAAGTMTEAPQQEAPSEALRTQERATDAARDRADGPSPAADPLFAKPEIAKPEIAEPSFAEPAAARTVDARTADAAPSARFDDVETEAASPQRPAFIQRIPNHPRSPFGATGRDDAPVAEQRNTVALAATPHEGRYEADDAVVEPTPTLGSHGRDSLVKKLAGSLMHEPAAPASQASDPGGLSVRPLDAEPAPSDAEDVSMRPRVMDEAEAGVAEGAADGEAGRRRFRDSLKVEIPSFLRRHA